MTCKHDKTCCKNYEPVEESESAFRKAFRTALCKGNQNKDWSDIVRVYTASLPKARQCWNTRGRLDREKSYCALSYTGIREQISTLDEPE